MPRKFFRIRKLHRCFRDFSIDKWNAKLETMRHAEHIAIAEQCVAHVARNLVERDLLEECESRDVVRRCAVGQHFSPTPTCEQRLCLPLIEQCPRGAVRSLGGSRLCEQATQSFESGVFGHRRGACEKCMCCSAKWPESSGKRGSTERWVPAEQLVATQARKHDLDSVFSHGATDRICIQTVE